jgi:O-antigen chain-terminating methyltransferase
MNSETTAVVGTIAALQEEIARQRGVPLLKTSSQTAALVQRVRIHQHVQSHLPIGWPEMPHGIVPKLVAIAQKVVRRLLRWYINPLVDQQNELNAALADLLALTSRNLDEEGALLRQLQKETAGQQSIWDQRWRDLSEQLKRRDGQVAELAELVAERHAEYVGDHQRLAVWQEGQKQEQAASDGRLAQVAELLERLRSEQNADKGQLAEVAGQADRWHVESLAEQSGLTQRIDQQLGWLGGFEKALAEHNKQWIEWQQRLEQHQSGVALRLQRMENWYRSDGHGFQGTASAPAIPAGYPSGIDYFLLGALYRNEAQSQAWLADYDDLFMALRRDQEAGRGPLGTVLDLGCGRGQFIARLCEMGLDAYGIDLDRDAVDIGRLLGRPVQYADVFEHLEQAEDGSLAVVLMMQVVEHFAPEDLLRLLRLAHAKIAPGGFLLAETVNPGCLYALSNWYLMDPSHRMPVHPRMAAFLLQQAGFARLETRFLHPVADRERLQPVASPEDEPVIGALTEALDRNTEQLNDFLYGPQDYAIVAYKGKE